MRSRCISVRTACVVGSTIGCYAEEENAKDKEEAEEFIYFHNQIYNRTSLEVALVKSYGTIH